MKTPPEHTPELTPEDWALVLVCLLWVHDNHIDLPDWTDDEVSKLYAIACKIRAAGRS